MSTKIKIITQKSKREKVNTEIKCKRRGKWTERRSTRKKRDNCKRRQEITKRKGTSKISIKIMIHSMKRVREKDFRGRGRKIEKVIRRKEFGKIAKGKVMA